MHSRHSLVSEPHLGITKSLNTGLKLAQGRFIARQDADDISHPDRLSIQLSWLQNYQYDLCCSRAFSIRKNRAIPRRWLIALPRLLVLRFLNPFIHSSFLFRKSCIDAIGGYDEDFLFAQDYKLIYDFYVQNYRIKYLSTPLIQTGHHPNSIGISHYSQQQQYSKTARTLFRSLKYREIL